MECFCGHSNARSKMERGRVTLGVGLDRRTACGSILKHATLYFWKTSVVQDQVPSADDVFASSPENGGCSRHDERANEEKLRVEGLHERVVCWDQHVSVYKAAVDYTRYVSLHK